VARDIRVHTGIAHKGTPRERKSAWIEVSVPLQLEGWELADGLGEHFLRNENGVEDGERPAALPESMTQQQIIRTYKEELLYWGTNLGTWSEGLSDEAAKVARGWLLDIVLDAFPAMKGYQP
jgi:hypothetical protein